MSEIRYLLDENVNPILRAELLRREPNLKVWQIGMLGCPDYGTLDPEILIWCDFFKLSITNFENSKSESISSD